MPDYSNLLARVTESRNSAYLVNGILALLIVLSAAHWVRQSMDRNYQLLLQGSQRSAPVMTSGVNTGELVSYNLFGAAPVSKPDLQTNIPLSSLNLKLTGIIASDENGYALISVNGQPQAPYFVGETVTQNAKLDQVLPDRVILLRGGTRESLMLDNESQKPLPGFAASVVKPAPLKKVNPASAIQKLGANKFALPKKVVAQNVTNMDVLKQALIVPNKDGGFLVKNVQQDGIFAKLGLKKGDVIHKVNNMPVNSMVDVMQLYRLTNDVDKVDHIQIELSRNGNDEVIDYNLK